MAIQEYGISKGAGEDRGEEARGRRRRARRRRRKDGPPGRVANGRCSRVMGRRGRGDNQAARLGTGLLAESPSRAGHSGQDNDGLNYARFKSLTPPDEVQS